MSNLERAIPKCKPYRYGGPNSYHGYLTPSEFLALCENGAIPNSSRDIPWATFAVNGGSACPRWLYFTVNNALAAKLPKPRKKKVGTRTKV
jgi:hypothetical protein